MGYRLPLATSVAIFLLLIAGSLVVGLKAGLACPDWPLCHGKLIPPLEGKVIIEYFHRLLSLLVSLMILWNVIVAWRKRKHFPLAARLTFFSIVLLIAVAGFGAINVILKLPPGFTAIDVGIANLLFGIYVFITALTFYQQKGGLGFPLKATLYKPALTGGLIVFLQLALGAFVEHSRAGLIVIQEQYRLLNVLIPSPTAAKVWMNIHLIVTYGVVAILLRMIFLARRKGVFQQEQWILAVLLGSQLAVGFLTVYSDLAIYATILHMSLASLMFAVCIWITVQAWMESYSKN
jgi:cytochrome c oxidase assembly protein subunit 15